jgi:DNA-binding NtrC family response regulator
MAVTADEVVFKKICGIGLQPMVTSNGSKILAVIAPFSESGPNRHDVRRISVLFVDDSPALANLICMYLQKNGEMTVDTSQSVKDAIHKLKYISYEVIITDYNISEEHGNALLRYGRAQGEWFPFVYFVAFRNSECENEAKHFGQVSFIEKMGSSGANLVKLRQAILDTVHEYRLHAVARPEQSSQRSNGSAKS